MTNNNQERRVFTRISFDANTHITQGDKSWDVVLVDLSLNGLLIKQPDNWHINSDLHLVAAITLDKETVIEMDVTEKHIANGCIGFQCNHIDIESISHLRRLVELNIGDLTLLERELDALGR